MQLLQVWIRPVGCVPRIVLGQCYALEVLNRAPRQGGRTISAAGVFVEIVAHMHRDIYAVVARSMAVRVEPPAGQVGTRKQRQCELARTISWPRRRAGAADRRIARGAGEAIPVGPPCLQPASEQFRAIVPRRSRHSLAARRDALKALVLRNLPAHRGRASISRNKAGPQHHRLGEGVAGGNGMRELTALPVLASDRRRDLRRTGEQGHDSASGEDSASGDCHLRSPECAWVDTALKHDNRMRGDAPGGCSAASTCCQSLRARSRLVARSSRRRQENVVRSG